MHPFSLCLLAVLISILAAAGQVPQQKEPTPAEKFARLANQFDQIEQTLSKERRATNTREENRAASERHRTSLKAWFKEALAAIRAHPADRAAFSVIEKYLARSDVNTAELAEVVRKHHLGNPGLGRLVGRFTSSREDKARAFALKLADKHPNRVTRGQAAFAIGDYARLKLVSDTFPFVTGLEPLSDAERRGFQTQAEKYLTLAAKDYADVPRADGTGTVGPLAQQELASLKNLPNLRPGQVAPEIVGEDLDGTTFKLGDHRGKVVLLVFWASWCGPCMRDIPHERELVEKFKGRPFVLVGVNGDRSKDKAKEAVEKAKIPWRSFAPYGGDRGMIPVAWNVLAWPTTYLIDHTGIIRHYNLRGKDLDGPLEGLVAKAEKKP